MILNISRPVVDSHVELVDCQVVQKMACFSVPSSYAPFMELFNLQYHAAMGCEHLSSLLYHYFLFTLNSRSFFTVVAGLEHLLHIRVL